ncbi:hypothetical protein [Donghicola eburneus]|uniref:hypothetical protein n=1 Tax=Donghicola eburneus TaxID=393278 RepID=UPI0015A5EA7E|nr:hypothetical protein [Donghicola eburneus]
MTEVLVASSVCACRSATLERADRALICSMNSILNPASMMSVQKSALAKNILLVVTCNF